jgi:predicted DNA-binding transcriptional regulator AlpA
MTQTSIKTIGIEELSAIIHKAVPSIRADICRRPERLPPRIKIPSSSRLLWLESDVVEWLNQNRLQPKESSK